MAYDEGLAGRIRNALRDRDDVAERKMFGGITFMVAGRMACGVVHDELMVRVGRDGHDAALAEPHTRPMDFTGRPMRGMVYVEPAGVRSDADLARWVERAVNVATAEPAATSTYRWPTWSAFDRRTRPRRGKHSQLQWGRPRSAPMPARRCQLHGDHPYRQCPQNQLWRSWPVGRDWRRVDGPGGHADGRSPSRTRRTPEAAAGTLIRF